MRLSDVSCIVHSGSGLASCDTTRSTSSAAWRSFALRARTSKKPPINPARSS